MAGTLLPVPIQIAADANNVPVAGALATFFLAGTTTPTTVYADADLTTPHSSPVVADAYGRWPPIYLTPGTSVKMVATTPALVALDRYPVDHIAAVPAATVNLDVTGVAGEALSAGEVVYLSDGSGSKVAGAWYLADSTYLYSSVYPVVGMVPADVASGATGTIRIQGRLTGLSGLVIGSTYYVSTAGAVSLTAGTFVRILGQADTTGSLVLKGAPQPIVDVSTCQGRLTLTTGVPVTTADVIAATTIYWTPYRGHQIALYDGTRWGLYPFTERSIALGTDTTAKPYDVFAYLDTAGAVQIERLVWTNATTRATALTTQDGVLVKTGVVTRRYLGSYYTTDTGKTEDSAANRCVWNYTHRVARPLAVFDETASWAYTTATWRQARATATNQVTVVQGWAEDPIDLVARSQLSNTDPLVVVQTGIGEDVTNAPLAASANQAPTTAAAGTISVLAALHKVPVVGYHVYALLEISAATGTTTWVGTASHYTGLTGLWRA